VNSRRTLVALVLVYAVLGGQAFAAAGTYTAGSTFGTDTGAEITLDSDTDLSGNPFADARTLELPEGTVQDRGPDGGEVTVVNLDTGDSAVVSDVSGPTVAVNPDLYDTVGLGGTIGQAKWSDIDTDAGNTDVTLQNAGSNATITIYGVAPDTFYKTLNASDGIVGINQSDSSGTVTLSVAGASSVDVAPLDNQVPALSNPSPDGEVQQETVTLAADVDDDQLPGSSLNLTWRVDGSVVHTETISSAGRYNYTLSSSEIPGSGSHSWSVTAEDQFGGESTLSASFGIPANLTIRNVSSGAIINNSTVTVFTDSGSVTKTTTNGTVSLDGLPGGEPLAIEVNSTDYRTRTVVLPSIIQQQTAYLLSKNTTAVETRFTLTDPSGEFPPESTLYVERPVTVNNTTEYRVVAGDQFGVEGVTTTLKEGQRYRLRVVAPNGSTAMLGKYTAELAEEVPLRPQSPAVRLGDVSTLSYNASADDSSVTLSYLDPTGQTEVLTVSIRNRFNESDYLLAPTTYYGTSELSQSVPLNGSLSDSYIVTFSGQIDGQAFQATVAIGPDQISLVPAGLSTVWLQIIGSGMVLVVGGLFSRLNVGVGAVVTSLTGGVLWYVGLLDGSLTGVVGSGDDGQRCSGHSAVLVGLHVVHTAGHHVLYHRVGLVVMLGHYNQIVGRRTDKPFDSIFGR